MLPNNYQDDLTQDFRIQRQPAKTYRLNFQGKASTGFINGLEAMKQAIFLILSCERYCYEIFSWNYGIELQDKLGQNNLALLQNNLKSAISEALLQDDRVLQVNNFSFVRNRNQLAVSFLVSTTEGNVESELVWDGKAWEVL